MLQEPKKLFAGLLLLTLALLLHVHMQVSIFKVSYAIQKNNKLFAELSDEFRLQRYELSKLYSPSYLDKRKKEMNLKLTVPREIKVVMVPEFKIADTAVIEAPPIIRQGLFSFANFIKEAQAKTSSRE